MKKTLLAVLMVAMVFSCAISAGAATAETPSVSDGMIEFIDDIFQNKDNVIQIVDENGNEVKYAFFLRHREDYKNSDYVSIAEDLADLSVITPVDDEDIMPAMWLDFKWSGKNNKTFFHGGKYHPLSYVIRVSGTFDDSPTDTRPNVGLFYMSTPYIDSSTIKSDVSGITATLSPSDPIYNVTHSKATYSCYVTMKYSGSTWPFPCHFIADINSSTLTFTD